MKKKVLLLDESLTVQKVVALTLDRNRYAVSYAKSRSEAMKWVLETPPDLILVSDQVADINVSLFPKEVESWVGRDRRPPPIILITGQDVKESRAYQAVLRKPFSPQALQAVVVEHTARSEEAPRPAPEKPRTSESRPVESRAERGDRGDRILDRDEPSLRPERTQPGEEGEDNRLQKIFSDTFNDEEKLTRETFQHDLDKEERTLLTIPAPPRATGRSGAPAPTPPRADPDDIWPPAPEETRETRPSRSGRQAPPPAPESAAELWGAMPKVPEATPEPLDIMGAEDSMAYKGVLENKVEDHLRSQDIGQVVEKLLERMLPPIVERLVQERLDVLLKEQEDFEELKP